MLAVSNLAGPTVLSNYHLIQNVNLSWTIVIDGGGTKASSSAYWSAARPDERRSGPAVGGKQESLASTLRGLRHCCYVIVISKSIASNSNSIASNRVGVLDYWLYILVTINLLDHLFPKKNQLSEWYVSFLLSIKILLSLHQCLLCSTFFSCSIITQPNLLCIRRVWKF